MRHPSFGSKSLMIVGLTLFTLGLILLLHETTVFGLFLQVFPDSITTIAFAAIILLAGQALVVSAAVKLNSAKLLRNLQEERQQTLATIARNNEQFQTKFQNERTAVLASYTQTMSKLDRLISNQAQQTASGQNTSAGAISSINCRYCGTKMKQSKFCPECGKANLN